MFKIPQSSKEFKQDNSSDRKGNISQTKNISFDDEGYITLSNRIRTIATSESLANLTDANKNISTIEVGGSDIILVGTNKLYSSSQLTPLDFVEDSASGSPTTIDDDSDAVYFKGELIVASAKLYRRSTSWVEIASGTSINSVCVFENLSQLAYSQDNVVTLIDASYVAQNTLVLPAGLSVTKMAWNNNRLYIATRRRAISTSIGINGTLFEWDGLSAEANAGYETSAHTIYSVVPYKNGAACVTSDGELLYNSGGWQLLDRLPVYYKKTMQWLYFGFRDSSQPIQKNAMKVIDDNIFIGIDPRVPVNRVGDRNKPRYFYNMPGGIWCYNEKVGLHHKYSIDSAKCLKTNAVTTSNINTTTDIITVAGVTVPETGTMVFYYNAVNGGTDANSATPLKHGGRYYTIYQSSTTFKIASSYQDAIDGVAINLTGTGNDSQYFIFQPDDQVGGSAHRVTAILPYLHYQTNENSRSESTGFWVAGVTYNDAGDVIATIGSVVEDQFNIGYYITPWMESQEILDSFNKIIQKFKPLVDEKDKLIIKYRTTECTLPDYVTRNGEDFDTTIWVDSNTYTTTQDLSMVSVGNEVEVIRGKGAGYTAHITSITENAGTYTVNIDENIPDVTAGDKLLATYQNWTKLDVVTKDSINNLRGFNITPITSEPATKAQFKIELRGFNIKTSEISVVNKTYQKAE